MARIVCLICLACSSRSYVASFHAMKLFPMQLGTVTMGAGLLLLLLQSLSWFPASFGQSKVHSITVRDSNILQQFLCRTNNHQIPNNTILELVSPSYVLNASRLCLVSNRHNISIVAGYVQSLIKYMLLTLDWGFSMSMYSKLSMSK